MSSTLAKQLLDLRLKQKDEIQLPKSVSISLLFQSSASKTLDIDQLYALVEQSIQDLAQEESLLNEVKPLLFQPRSTHFRRSQLKKEALDLVEKAVIRTIDLLGPFFREPAAIQILEYLFRVYEAHAYFKQKLILTFLPFCESTLFTRLMQQLNLTEELRFLNHFAKKGNVLSQDSLIYHAARGHLTFFVKAIKNALESQIIGLEESNHQPRFDIYSSLISGTFRLLFRELAGFNSQAQSTTIMALMPLIAQILGNQSQHMSSLKLGTAWALIELTSITKLNQVYSLAFISEFVNLAEKDVYPGLYLSAIVRVCESQEVQTLDEKTLAQFYWWIEDKQQLQSETDQIKLTSLLLKSLVSNRVGNNFASKLLTGVQLCNQVELLLDLLIFCCLNEISPERAAILLGPDQTILSSLKLCLERVSEAQSHLLTSYTLELFGALNMKDQLLVKSNLRLVQPSKLFSQEKEDSIRLKFISQLAGLSQTPIEVIQTITMTAFASNQSQTILDYLLNITRPSQDILRQVESFIHRNSTRYSSQFILRVGAFVLEADPVPQISNSSYFSLILFFHSQNKEDIQLSESLRELIPLESILRVVSKKNPELPHNSDNRNAISSMFFEAMSNARGYTPRRLILQGIRNIVKKEGLHSPSYSLGSISNLFTQASMSQNPDQLLNLLYECIEKASHLYSASAPQTMMLLELTLISQTYLPLALLLLKQILKKQSVSALYKIASSHGSEQTVVNSLWLAQQILKNSSQFPSSSVTYSVVLNSLMMLMKSPASLVTQALLKNLKELLRSLNQKGSLKSTEQSKVLWNFTSNKKISLSKLQVKSCLQAILSKQAQILISPETIIQIMPSLSLSSKLLSISIEIQSLENKLSFLRLFQNCNELALDSFLSSTELDMEQPRLFKAKLALIQNNLQAQPLKYFFSDYFPFLDQNIKSPNQFFTRLILELQNTKLKAQQFIAQELAFLLSRYDFQRSQAHSHLAELLSEAVVSSKFKVSHFRRLMLSNPLNLGIIRSGFSLLQEFETAQLEQLNQLCFQVLSRLFVETEEGIESRTFHKLSHLIYPLILQTRRADSNDTSLLQDILTRSIYHINDVSNAYMLKKEQEKPKTKPKFSVLAVLQTPQTQQQELDQLASLLLSKIQTVYKVLSLIVQLCPSDALSFFPALIDQLQKQSIESKVLHKLKGSVCFSEGMAIHQQLFVFFSKALIALLNSVAPSKQSYSLLKKALRLILKFQNPSAQIQKSAESILSILCSFNLESNAVSHAVLGILFLHKSQATEIVHSFYGVCGASFFYYECLALLFTPLQGTHKSYRSAEKKHIDRIVHFFTKQDVVWLTNLDISLTNQEVSEVFALLLTSFQQIGIAESPLSEVIQLVKTIYFLLFSRNLAYKNNKVIKSSQKEVNVQRKLLKSLSQQVVSVLSNPQLIETVKYFTELKRKDSYGTLFDELLYQLAFSLLARVEKEPGLYYQEYQLFLAKTAIPLFQEGADLWQARFIQLLLNITNALVPASISCSKNQDFLCEKVPQTLLQILKEELSYPPFKCNLVHMTAVITLTNIVKTYKAQTFEFCNPLFDFIYQSLMRQSPEFVKKAAIKCISAMVESIKDFMSGRLLEIFKVIIKNEETEPLMRAVVHNVALRSSIKPLIRLYQTIDQSQSVSEFNNYCQLMNYLMRYSKDKQVLQVSHKMTQLFTVMLGFSGQVIGGGQDRMNEAIVQFFLKLKEGELRETMQHFIEEENKSQNSEFTLAFYRLLIKTLDTLRHFAVPYFLKVFERLHHQFGQLVKALLPALKPRKFEHKDATNISQSKGSQTTLAIYLDLIKRSYKHDSKGAISLMCFEMLGEPLSLLYKVRAFPNFSQFAQQSLNCCVVQMFDSVDDLDKQRELLNSILLSLREEVDRQNKKAIADLIFSLLQCLGDRFLPHLKDTVPFLTELMEDQDENVAKAAQKSVYKIETMTGESLKDYI